MRTMWSRRQSVGMGARQQQGYVVWIVFAVLLAALLGAWQYGEQKKRRRAAEAQAQVIAAQRAEAERVEKERKATEQRIAEQSARNDALTSSLKKVDDLVVRWIDALRVAGTTARIQLAVPVSSMQAIRREAEGLTVPPCLDTGKVELLKSMDASIEGFLTFMRNEFKAGDELSRPYMEEAANALKEYQRIRRDCPA